MKALLVLPRTPWPYRRQLRRAYLPPLGLGYLAAILRDLGVEVSMLDLNVVDLSRQGFAAQVAEGGYDLLGVSTTTESASNAYRVCRLAKQVAPQTITVAGGAHVSFLPTEALDTGVIDYVVMGEGEQTLAELIRHLRGQCALAQINGLAYREGDAARINRRRPPIRDLDTLPFPARELYQTHCYGAVGVIAGSRGCPGRCVFCSAGAMAGGRYRARSVAGILAEIEDLVQHHDAHRVLFTDNTLTAIPRRTEALCRGIRERKLEIDWFCESRVDTVTPALLGIMADAGCSSIQFGLESGNQRLLDASGKAIELSQIRTAVRACIEAGIMPSLSYMIGHPEDNHETIIQTRALASEMRSLGAFTVASIMVPLPGTPLLEHPEEYGITIHATSWDDFQMVNATMSTRQLTADEIRAHFFEQQLELNREAQQHPLQRWLSYTLAGRRSERRADPG